MGHALTLGVAQGWAMLRFQRSRIELATRDQTNTQPAPAGE